ncbi:MAG: hypothetical protein AAGE88_10970 [Actinomycetota bacterium]
MAETAVPSVRGRTRLLVAAILVSAATASGVVAGLLAAVLLAPIAALTGARADALPVAVALIGVAVILDLAALLVGGPRPPAGGRQVPREWGRLLRPTTVAALYGARLGVGPLTILSTWTWWAVTIAAGLMGPAPAALVGGTFGLIRMLVTVGVSLAALDPAETTLFRRLRGATRPSRATLTGLAALALAASAATGCAAGSDAASPPAGTLRSEVVPTLVPADEYTSSLESSLEPPPPAPDGRSAADADADRRFESLSTAPGIAKRPSADDPRPDGADTDDDNASPSVTTPAQLEDFVRLSPADPTAAAQAAATRADARTTVSAEPTALADVLLDDVARFDLVDDPTTDRYLDLRDAADIQPDPTEEIALLETRGYEGGWTRAFRSDGNDVLVTSVYQFADAAEAEFYLEDGLITIGGYGGRFFDIEGLPGVRGFAQEFSDDGEDLRSLGAAFQTGPRWHLVYLVGSADTVTPDALFPAVEAQRSAALDAVGPAGPASAE